MKTLWYYVVKAVTRLGFTFYFNNVRLEGVANIPKDKPLLLVANHQNALIDPLLIGAYSPRVLHFLTRADVFNKPLIKMLLSSVNMMPIYRIRDGRSSLNKNQAIFDKCQTIFDKNGCVLIFPEGNHNIRRRIRPLSKGFTRIVSGSLEKNPDLNLYIQPIGINYSGHKRYRSKVSIYYGNPIKANDYVGALNDNGDLLSLRDKVSDEMKLLTTHIDDLDNYDKIASNFEPQDFLYPEKVNTAIASDSFPTHGQTKGKKGTWLQHLVRANTLLPLFLWRRFKPGISEPEFIATFKFVFAILIVPVCYAIQAIIVAWLFGSYAAWTYLSVSILLAFMLTKNDH